MRGFDELDMKLLFELTKDGNISVPILSKKLGINSSVLYSRIKRLVRKKLIKKFTIEINIHNVDRIYIYYYILLYRINATT